MRNYIGCKIVKAEVMGLDTFNIKFNKAIQVSEQTSTEGYHVRYPSEYDSWSPKEVFERAYRVIARDEVFMLGLQENESG